MDLRLRGMRIFMDTVTMTGTDVITIEGVEASLVIAGPVAEGETVNGYERLESRLAQLGARNARLP